MPENTLNSKRPKGQKGIPDTQVAGYAALEEYHRNDLPVDPAAYESIISRLWRKIKFKTFIPSNWQNPE